MARKVHIEPPAGNNLSTLQGAGVSVMPVLMVDSSEYLPILNAPAINQLAALSNAPITKTDPITLESVVESRSARLFISNYGQLFAPRGSVFKLFDMLCIELTRANTYRGKKGAEYTTVIISVDKYMELCGIKPTKPNKDKARLRIKEDMQTLYEMSIEATDPAGGKDADFSKIRLCTDIHRRTGEFIFTFHDKLANLLVSSYIGQYPTAIFRLDDRNKNAYPLARKLAMHASNLKNIEKGTADILSVETLLAECPDIPKYERVIEEGRQVSQRIIEPLEKTLDVIVGEVLTHWEYCNSKGAPLTEEQLAARDWHTFSRLYVRFKMKDEPDYTERLQRKAERQAKASKTRRKRKPVKKSDSEK